MRISETRFRLLLESAGEGIVGLDAKGRCTFINRSALNQTGYTEDEVLGRDMQSMLGYKASPERIQSAEESGLESLLRDYADLRCIETFQHKDGSRFFAEWASYPIEYDGVVDSSVLVFRDETESLAQLRKLAYRASHDPLTGLVNRSEFERRLTRVLSGRHNDKTEHVLCFIDIDHFKDINDSYGHAAGDHALSCFGALLRSKLRQRDTLSRLGGDEFALLLEHTPVDHAYEIAYQLCECTINMQLTWVNQNFSISISIGISALAGTENDMANVLRRADTACCIAKKNGRNQIHVFNCLNRHNPNSPILNECAVCR